MVSTHGFLNSISLFVYAHNSDLINFLVYVDDLIIIGNNQQTLNNFVVQLFQRFSLKDLGNLNFLKVETIPTSFGLFLS